MGDLWPFFPADACNYLEFAQFYLAVAQNSISDGYWECLILRFIDIMCLFRSVLAVVCQKEFISMAVRVPRPKQTFVEKCEMCAPVFWAFLMLAVWKALCEFAYSSCSNHCSEEWETFLLVVSFRVGFFKRWASQIKEISFLYSVKVKVKTRVHNFENKT